MGLSNLTGFETAEKIRNGEVSALEVANAALERIDQLDSKIRAFLTVDHEDARSRAKAADEKLSNGEAGPLCGVPVAIKDNMAVRGLPTTCASKILEEFRPPFDCTATSKLEEAGAVIIGKTNLDEYAMGSSTENSGFFATRNPWNTGCIPGGSSGGSAAAVAAGMAPVALGSDTGGSIRQPASFCGIVGAKPTYGRVSRYGLVAYGSSLDQIGPLARDVRDAALMMNVIAGHDERDSTSATKEVPDYLANIEEPVKGLKVGLPKEYFGEGLSEDVAIALDGAVDVLKSQGVEVREISLPHTEYAIATYYLLATAEASSNLARYDGVHYGYRAAEANDIIEMYSRSRRDGFGLEVKRRIMLGTYALSSGYYDAYYSKASKVRTLIREDFDAAYEEVDCIVCPAAPTPAFKLGEKTDNPLQMYLSDIYTISLNLAGLPGISIPCGFSSDGLPIGMQIFGRAWDEETMLRIALAYQKMTDHHEQRPNL